MRRPVRAVFVLPALALALAGGTPAHADFQSVYEDYQADGTIDACRHSSSSLDGARSQIPNDIEQYAPDFRAALEAATHQRNCAGGRRGRDGAAGAGLGEGISINAPGTPGGPGGPPTADGLLVPRPPVPPRVVTPAPDPAGAVKSEVSTVAAAGNRTTPAPLVILAVLAVLILAGLVLTTLGRFLGWGEGPLAPARHGLSEAAMRVGAAAGGVLDRLRPGGFGR